MRAARWTKEASPNATSAPSSSSQPSSAPAGTKCCRCAKKSILPRGRIIVRGKLVTRGKAKKADFVLYYKPNIPIALIEAKDNNHSVAMVSNRASIMQRRWIFPLYFPPTVTAFCSMTAPAVALRSKRTLALTPFRRPPNCGRGIAPGRASTPRPNKSCFRIISTTAAARRRAIIR
jgi:hypothetical protein